ncbi:MAG TPA: hypothetical protein VF520_08205 [Thermoleophilaceae bacterium]|jgi:hypothetical protein
MSVRRLARPRGVCVRVDRSGVPSALRGERVEAVLEEWVVEDRWWTGTPLRRRYFELVLAGGRNAVVFRDVLGGGWFEQTG